MTTARVTAFDEHMMAIAIRMARTGLGQTRPNPSVGAVIANEKTGEVLARAVTANGGRPHAETQAIAAAGSRAKGATLYVTLEPCSHHGHTGPCADAIIAAGITRVVVAIEDPDPRVAGRGLDRLRAAGIEVVRGVLAAEARWVTRGHIVRVTERRPLVTLKLAVDTNGHISPGVGGKPVWVTGEAARANGQLLRARHDAILVGRGTVIADDPSLTCRLPGLSHRSPVRVVLAQTPDFPAGNLAATIDIAPLWVMCSHDALRAQAAQPTRIRAEMIGVSVVDGKLWLPAVMEALVARGITRLLVEGGPTIWRAFAIASLIDEVVLYMARSCETTAMSAITRYLGPVSLHLRDRQSLGPDTLWRFRRAHSSVDP